jgi:hypothetical protein
MIQVTSNNPDEFRALAVPWVSDRAEFSRTGCTCNHEAQTRFETVIPLGPDHDNALRYQFLQLLSLPGQPNPQDNKDVM